MAIDKAVDSAALEANLTTIANAIREKAGTSGALAFPAGFAEAIAGIKAGGATIFGLPFIEGKVTYAEEQTAPVTIYPDVSGLALDGDPAYTYNKFGVFFYRTPDDEAFNAYDIPKTLADTVALPLFAVNGSSQSSMRVFASYYDGYGSVRATNIVSSNGGVGKDDDGVYFKVPFSSSMAGAAGTEYSYIVVRMLP